MNVQTKIPSALRRIIPGGDERALAYFMPSQAAVDNKRCGLAQRPDYSRMVQGTPVSMGAETRGAVADFLRKNPGANAADIAAGIGRTVDGANKALHEMMAFGLVRRKRNGNRGSYRYEVAR